MNLILNFSGRTNGNCHKIGMFLKDKVTDSELIDFGDISISPCGSCHYECFQDRLLCPHRLDGVYGLYQKIDLADTVYYIVPNYCDYPCANFFLFNERSQCYFQGREDLLRRYLAVQKRFVVVSNSMQENFIIAFRYHVDEKTEPEILFLSSKAFGKRSIDGDLLSCAEVRERLLVFAQRE